MKSLYLGISLLGLAVLFFVFLGYQYTQADSPAPEFRALESDSLADHASPLTAVTAAAKPSHTEISSAESSEGGSHALSADQQRIAVAMEKFKELRGRALINALSQDPLAEGIQSRILLAMVEAGYLDINGSIANRAGLEFFSPLFLAVAAEWDVTAEVFSRFLALGARVDSSDNWQRMMSNVTDAEVLDLWYDAAGLGPERHQELFNEGLRTGNMAFVDFILENKNGKFDQLTFTGAMTTNIQRQILTQQSISDERMSELYEQTQPEERARVQHMLTLMHERRARQIELLLTYADLSEEDRKKMTELRATLEEDIQRVADYFAQQPD
ncbi:hypothetical protein [Pseudidiomarina terrestris]|uniref:hypothetical protein n=1 Tax=Pseudidiomarina terrestris TaxID=2820060 RepID=UPI002653D63D|nr:MULTISPECIES: hypothetical protein [unclassified Pseudidiomarina]MDN7127943.1 hypothetical protein [Pseudidiomarina sp. 1APR75-33.1]MDN7135603.1 hypothetical protein [Pseudidiomarina sp. 1ASP75-5]MEA3589114.1 hypothetical protein [Pseudidiomarina sp. 1APP75-27a]